MTAAAGVAPSTTELVDRLASHRTLGGAPREELEWIATHGNFVHMEAGQIVARKNDPADFMFIQLSGRTTAAIDRGSGMRYMLETRGGDVTARLPFSRMQSTIADVVTDEAVDAIAVHRDAFPEMIRACPVVVETLVHHMLDRTRALAATTMHDDKMMAMGRMAAGLAHELNNPASAAARSAKLLHEAMIEAREAWRVLCSASLTEDERAKVEALADQSLVPATTGVFSAIERSDREEEVMEWLDDHDADHAPAATLAESGVTTDTLDELAGAFSGHTLDVVLRWVAADYTARSLGTDVERAAVRIHDLVSAVKRFAYVDRAAAPEPASIAQSLMDTVAVLATKAKSKAVAIRMDVPADLPSVLGRAGEINQIWSNLIENAIDAVPPNGEINVVARYVDGDIVVRVIDNGPGIPAELQTRIFDPFFTTKSIGQGTGLGLDIALSAVRAHGGQLALESQPGRTEFRVTLPVAPPKSS